MSTSRRFRPRSVTGRRLRRRIRAEDETNGDDTVTEDDLGERWPSADDVQQALSSLTAPEVTVAVEEPRGFWASLKGMFSRDKRGERERGAPVPADDPVREVLAIPQGAARLDAFEQTVRSLTPGTPGHKSVALGFHRELSTMAARAGVDLKLLKRRVEACADALVDAGEHERAGELLARVGKQHRAAELFASAGAIEKLEAAHFDIENEEGAGRHHEARLAFERFEALFLVGQRLKAFDELARAHQLWPQNPVYEEILRGTRARQLPPGRLCLKGRSALMRIEQRWPVIIGRGESAGVRLKSPLISRQHAELALVGDRPFFRPVQSRQGTSVNGTPADRPVELEGEGTIDLGGVELSYRVSDEGVHIGCVHQPDEVTITVTGCVTHVPIGEGRLELTFDDEGRAFVSPSPGLTLNQDAVRHRTLLLDGDVLARDGERLSVDMP